MTGLPEGPEDNQLSAYAGRWIARIGERIVGQGGTPQQARQAALAARFKENLEISYVPTASPISFPPLLDRVRALLPADQEIYLVGGAVRDLLLMRPTHDMDFVVPAGALQIGRRVADALQGAYFPLDEQRQTARVILHPPEEGRMVLDFSIYRGPDLDSDLHARDFTINAIAIDMHAPDTLLDPLGGASDLRAKSLRACSPHSLSEDPVRILRAIRLAAALDLHIQADTRRLMRQAVPGLTGVTAERLRDELIRTLNGPQPGTAVRALDMLGALPVVLPEMEALKGVTQSAPHVFDVWAHTLDVLQKLEGVLQALAPSYDPDASANLMMGLLSLRLGRFREQISAHLGFSFTPDRPARGLLFLAALYHDVAKPHTRQVDADGRVRFFNHDQLGAETVSESARALHLSNDEIVRLEKVVRLHLRPMFLGQGGKLPSKRSIYRFFRAAGEAGIDICLLSLADVLGTYGPTLPQEYWSHHLDVVRALMEAWWEHPQSSVAPPSVVDGNVLIEELNLEPGPLIGQLLEVIREAQVNGEVHSRADALATARSWLERGEDGNFQE